MFRAALVAAVLSGLSPRLTTAHPVSLTRATAFVERETMTVAIEVFLEDLFLFHGLEPDAQNRLALADLQQGMEKHKGFLSRGFIVRNVEGERIDGRIVDVVVGELPPGGIDVRELMNHTITYVLQYKFAQAPDFLTLEQRFGGGKSAIPAFVTASVKQEGGAPEPDAELPYGEAYSFRFVWDRPPLSADASEEERKNWFAERQKEQLGITDFSATYSFLYIDDFEVRHEILMPLKTLEQWLRLKRRDDAFLEVDEQEAARGPVEEFFAAGNPVEIDGIRVQPVLSRLDFFSLDRADLAQAAERKRVGTASARVGIILSYSTKGPPRQVKVTWDQYNLNLWSIPAVIYAYDKLQQFEFVQFGDPFQWVSPGREPLPPVGAVSAGMPAPPGTFSLPVGTVGCLLALAAVSCYLLVKRAAWSSIVAAACVLGGAAAVAAPFSMIQLPAPWSRPPAIAEKAAGEVFASLHKNVYRAFDYRREEQIYDALATSVDGDRLADLSVQVRQGLEMREQGGAISRVRAVEIVAGNLETADALDTADSRGFTYRCTWQVEGTVEHWGHIHTRRNEYEAFFAVEPHDNQWKITQMKPLTEKRVKYRTGLRLS
jgi:hypothetical protein